MQIPTLKLSGSIKPILVVTRRFPVDVEYRIARDYLPRFNLNEEPFTQKELLAAAEGADALFVSPEDRLDADFFTRLDTSVKVIATFSVGYDHIDLEAAAAKPVAIANTPGVLTEATADITLLLLLGASRRAYEGQQLVRSGRWNASRLNEILGWQLGGKVLGIFGMGRIGRAVAERARAFGMKIHYTNRKELPGDLAAGATYHVHAKTLLNVSQFLTLHVPFTPETRHFLNTQSIGYLPKGAIVVNTARGGLVNDDDLIAALRSGQVAAAGLDVYEGEPDVNPRYLDLPNVFLLPHLGSATLETRSAMGMLALDNIDAILAGNPAPSLISGGVASERVAPYPQQNRVPSG